jgi:hypothetical protein
VTAIALRSPHAEHLALGHLLAGSLSRRGRLASEQRDETDRGLREQLWGSLLVARELGPLARREQLLIERYGEKNVEARFEEQLNLFFQSVGFTVIPATRGQRRVDLVCISTDAAPYTIIVDAKSSAQPYSLPTKDARALVEYVDRMRAQLKVLPPLKLVLLVGGAPSRSLPNKLREASLECGVPVRYCPAGLLASMRSRLPGNVSSDAFLRHIGSSNDVVSPEAVQRILDKTLALSIAHRDFINDLVRD